MAEEHVFLSKAQRAHQILTGKGWTKVQSCGIIANIEAESNFNEHAVGDGGTAYGLCQWHPNRQANFRTHFGHSIQVSSFDEQVEFIDVELNGTEHRAGNALRGTTTADEAGRIVSERYERPRDPTGAVAAHRGQRAEDWCQIL